jgi:hypothetical protein
LAEICAVAYVLQLREIEREVIAAQALAVHVPDMELPTIWAARAEFDALLTAPIDTDRPSGSVESGVLSEVLGVARR